MCTYVHPHTERRRCELLLMKFSFNQWTKVLQPKFHPGLIYVMSACGINMNLY